jgi:hypothetical protein
MFVRPVCIFCGELLTKEDIIKGFCRCEQNKKNSYIYYKNEQGFITVDIDNKNDDISRKSYLVRTLVFCKRLKIKPVKRKEKKQSKAKVLRKKIKQKNSQKNDFYSSKEWLAIRYDVIEKYGRVCCACGARTKSIHVDHIKPRSTYPELELEINNLQILCPDCNRGKSNRYSTDWRPDSKLSKH